MIFFLAGYETTASAMSWVFYNLVLNENAQQTLFDEIEQALQDIDVRSRSSTIIYLFFCRVKLHTT